MKNIIFASVVLGLTIGVNLALQSTEARAGLWTSLTGAFADTVESKMFAIEAQGTNIRGYAFENPAHPGHFCVQTASEGGNGGLSCDWSE